VQGDSILARTYALLETTELSKHDIYCRVLENGTNITFYWLRDFIRGRYKDPGIQKVQAVYEVLTGEPFRLPK